MTGRLQLVPLYPGLYRPNASMLPADGNFTAGDLTPTGDGNLTATTVTPAVPQLQYLPAEGNGRYGPRVEIVLEGLNSGGGVTLWRECEDQRLQVRGGVRRMGVDSVLIVDSEVPFGRPVTYRAEMLNADFTSAGFTPGVDIILDQDTMGADYGKSFVHNVLEPSRALEYVFAGDALGSLAQNAPGALWSPDGAAHSLWVGGRATGLTGVNLSGSTYSLDDAQTMRDMFGTRTTQKLPILVVRTPPELFLPPTFFGAVQWAMQPVNVAWGGGEWVRWAMTGDEVAPPFPALAEPGVTVADLATVFDTLAEAAEVYPTLLDAARDYSLVGLAGN